MIGMSWAAYFLGRGLSVRATDVDPAAQARTKAYIERASIALEGLGLVAPSARGATISFHASVEEAAAGCDFVQENGPESETLKAKLLARVAGSSILLPLVSQQASFADAGRAAMTFAR
jgi:carnitine 3-dehydrogenase